jgi:hypothetical protein
MIEINEKWRIETDNINFILQRPTKSGRWEAIAYYPCLDYLLAGLLKWEVLESDSRDFVQLSGAVERARLLIESIGSRLDLRKTAEVGKKSRVKL